MDTPQQQFDKELAATRAQTQFPMDKIPAGTRDLFLKAMLYNSIARVRCHMIVYKNLLSWNKDTKFVVVEVSLIIDILRAATPMELNQTLKENLEMLEKIVTPIHQAWNELDEQLSEPIKRRIEAKMKAEKSVPQSKKTMKIPVAQA